MLYHLLRKKSQSKICLVRTFLQAILISKFTEIAVGLKPLLCGFQSICMLYLISATVHGMKEQGVLLPELDPDPQFSQHSIARPMQWSLHLCFVKAFLPKRGALSRCTVWRVFGLSIFEVGRYFGSILCGWKVFWLSFTHFGWAEMPP